MDFFATPTVLNEDAPMNAIMFGESCAGKSSTIGTFSGKKIIYITTSVEAHGVVNAMRVNSSLVKQGKKKPCIFVHINLGMVQDLDFKTEFLKTSNGLKVGEVLPSQATAAKLFYYLEFIKNVSPDVVVVDSLSSMYEDLKASPEVIERCTSSGGQLNQWTLYAEIDSLYNKSMNMLRSLNYDGVHTVCTCLSKFDDFKEVDGVVIPVHFSPVIPSVSAAKVVKSWFDTSLQLFRHRNVRNNQPFFNFEIQGSRTSRTRDTKEVANDASIDLRSQYLPFGKSLDMLPADLENLQENTIKRSEYLEKKAAKGEK